MQNALSTVAIIDSGAVTWQQKPVNSLTIGDTDVHIWRIGIADHVEEIHSLKTLLTPAETERGDRYLHQADRNRFAISRGYQRIILGSYLNMPPALLHFALGNNKKPYIANSDAGQLNYNVSHSGNWILIAISWNAIGCDVEHIDPDFEFADILPDNFSAAEIKYINSEDSTNRFFKLWTRKEALLKATSQGLGDHLIDTPSLNGISKLALDMQGVNHSWLVKSFEVDAVYAGSVATTANTSNFSFFDIV